MLFVSPIQRYFKANIVDVGNKGGVREEGREGSCYVTFHRKLSWGVGRKYLASSGREGIEKI